MLAQVRVTFNTFNNHVEHIGADAELRFRERNEVFTVMRKYPNAVLQPHETVFVHKSPQAIPHALASLWDIEDDDTPSSIPFPLFGRRRFLRLKFQHSLPLFSEARIAAAVSFFKRDEAIRREPSERCLRLVIELGAFLRTDIIFYGLRKIRYRTYRDHDAAERRIEHRVLKCSQSPFPPRSFFHHPHSSIVPRTISKN